MGHTRAEYGRVIVALVLVNDAPQSKEYRVQDDDVIKLIAVVGGG